jgi:hypothetical protein
MGGIGKINRGEICILTFFKNQKYDETYKLHNSHPPGSMHC